MSKQINRLIVRNWLKQGLSRDAIRAQKIISLKNGVATILNTKHGMLTFISVEGL